MSLSKEKERAIEGAIAQIEREFGKGSIMRLGEKGRLLDVKVIPTGALPLDLALGVGGVPRGRITEIYGPEASGKTTLALHVVAEAQKGGGVAAFIDAEHALDPVYARKLGVKDVIGGLLPQNLQALGHRGKIPSPRGLGILKGRGLEIQGHHVHQALAKEPGKDSGRRSVGVHLGGQAQFPGLLQEFNQEFLLEGGFSPRHHHPPHQLFPPGHLLHDIPRGIPFPLGDQLGKDQLGVVAKGAPEVASPKKNQ